jgi:hypothetical protein
LFVSATYVRNRSANQLLNYDLPSITGFSNVLSNFPAIVENTAIETVISGEILRSKSIKWSASLNLTLPKNKLVSFPGLDSSSYRDQYVVGKPIEEGNIYSKTYRFYGVNPANGIYQVYDHHGNPTSSPTRPDDAVVLLNHKPKLYGGISNSIAYKGLAIEFLLSFSIQKNFNFFQNATVYPGNFARGRGNQPIEQLKRWQNEGDISTFQRFSSDLRLLEYSFGDRDLQDLSYLRLKNISVSYSFEKTPIGFLRSSQVFINAQNLLTITNYKGLDVETLSVMSLPPLKVVTIGVKVGM